MNPNYDESEYVSEDDNESDIWFMTKALDLHEMMEQEEMGLTSNSREPINCEYDVAEERLIRDYFSDHPKFSECVKCSKLRHSQFGRGDKKYPRIMLEAVASQEDIAHAAPFQVNGVQYEKEYYLDPTTIFQQLPLGSWSSRLHQY
ncbi:ALP1-like protein [Tanacetum coccineum]|uniref:ALP1-like protein n=1 Tax=Tanacetum coccineum TaxID=301880 RepID=A0ABQ5AVE6_9ASTR